MKRGMDEQQQCKQKKKKIQANTKIEKQYVSNSGGKIQKNNPRTL